MSTPFRQPQGIPTGGQFATSTRSESPVSLRTKPTLADIFDPGDADQADFEFDWTYMDFDEHNGYSAYDPDEPKIEHRPLAVIEPGDEVLVEGTASVFRRVGATHYDGEAHCGRIAVWAEDPQTDRPFMTAHSEDIVTTRRKRTEPDLSDPVQFNRELSRRVYEETARHASRADESHDVERIANRLAKEFLPALVTEAIAQGVERRR